MWKLSEPVPALDSREVAQLVGKRHGDLLRDIERYEQYLSESTERNFALSDFFQRSQYQDSTGRTLPCYLVTKQGCELIAHKLTGKKGVLFTASYIERFHAMEEALKEPTANYQVMYYKGAPILPEEDFLRMMPPSKKKLLYDRRYFRPGWDYNGMGLDLKAEFEEKYGRRYPGETLMYLRRSGVKIALRLYNADPEISNQVMALVEPKKELSANPMQTYLPGGIGDEIGLTIGNVALNIRL